MLFHPLFFLVVSLSSCRPLFSTPLPNGLVGHICSTRLLDVFLFLCCIHRSRSCYIYFFSLCVGPFLCILCILFLVCLFLFLGLCSFLCMWPRCPLVLCHRRSCCRLLKMFVLEVCWMPLLFDSTPLFLSLHCMLVPVLRSAADVAVVLRLSHSSALLSWLRLAVACCCHAHSVPAQIPTLGMILRSCCCRMLASKAAWGSWCCVFQWVRQNVGRFARKLQGPLRVGVACTLLLQRRLWCWWVCIWGCLQVVSIFLFLPVLWLPLSVLHLLELLLLFLFLEEVWHTNCPVCPCMPRNCISILRMLHSSHRMLVAWVSVCVARPGCRSLLCLLPLMLPLLVLRVPHTLLVGIKPSACLLLACLCWAATQVLCLLEPPWMFPGFSGSCWCPVVTAAAVHSFVCWALLNHYRLKACWTKMLSTFFWQNCCMLCGTVLYLYFNFNNIMCIYIYIYPQSDG